MANHRWEDKTEPFGRKQGECTKCGIVRYWCGGYMQCWNYLDLREPEHSKKRDIYTRPECKPDKL